MNINGRIHTGMRDNHKGSIQEKKKRLEKINTVMKKWRKRLEVKHNLQFLFLRQKTPPTIKNTAKVAIMINT